jgi:hypothetical protein
MHISIGKKWPSYFFDQPKFWRRLWKEILIATATLLLKVLVSFYFEMLPKRQSSIKYDCSLQKKIKHVTATDLTKWRAQRKHSSQLQRKRQFPRWLRNSGERAVRNNIVRFLDTCTHPLTDISIKDDNSFMFAISGWMSIGHGTPQSHFDADKVCDTFKVWLMKLS